MQQKRISIFVDGANIFYAQKNTKFVIDWKKVLNHWAKIGSINDAFYYIGKHMPPVARTEKYIKLLRSMQFIIREKQIKTIIDDKGNKKQKANLDIEIVIDMFNTMENYDIAVLFSGDGDFERAHELLRSRGKCVYIVSTRTSVARELLNCAGNKYIDFTQMSDWKLRDWEDKSI